MQCFDQYEFLNDSDRIDQNAPRHQLDGTCSEASSDTDSEHLQCSNANRQLWFSPRSSADLRIDRLKASIFLG